MISTHCGERLSRLTGDTESTRHRWRCNVCKQTFTQKLRQGAHRAIARNLQKSPGSLMLHLVSAAQEWERLSKNINAPGDGRFQSGVAHGIALARQFIFGEITEEGMWPPTGR